MDIQYMNIAMLCEYSACHKNLPLFRLHCSNICAIFYDTHCIYVYL